MDRRLAEKNLRAGLVIAAIAVGVFGMTFVLALLYIR